MQKEDLVIKMFVLVLSSCMTRLVKSSEECNDINHITVNLSTLMYTDVCIYIHSVLVLYISHLTSDEGEVNILKRTSLYLN